MPPGPLTTAMSGFVVSGSSSGGSSPGHVRERLPRLEVREQLLERLDLLPRGRIARLRLLAHPLEPPLDVVAVGDEQLEPERLEVALRVASAREAVGDGEQRVRLAQAAEQRAARSRARPRRGSPPASPCASRRAPRRASSRSSAMVAMPTFAFSVTDAYAVTSAPACVSALKSVVLPAVRQADEPDLHRHRGLPLALEADAALAGEALRVQHPREDEQDRAVLRLERERRRRVARARAPARARRRSPASRASSGSARRRARPRCGRT